MNQTIIQKIKRALSEGQKVGAILQGGFTFVHLTKKSALWSTLNVELGFPTQTPRSDVLDVSIEEADDDCLTLKVQNTENGSSFKVGYASVVLIESTQA